MGALEEILRQHRVWRGDAALAPVEGIATGYDVLDRELPGGGWPRGALAELLAAREGFGEVQLVLPALAALTQRGRRVAWLAPPHLPYAPALAAAGLDLTRLAGGRAPGRRDALWAAEQVLRSASCEALLAWLPEARYAELRRLAVAADEGGACLLAFRPLAAAAESSPAALRLVLEPAGDGVGVRFLKRRGRGSGAAAAVVNVWKPVHAVGRTELPLSPARGAGADRRLGLPVHA
ncbi:MAG: translesion DNA synthesis-associated protein ImuA [Betaproteobacteria bacterium]